VSRIHQDAWGVADVALLIAELDRDLAAGAAVFDDLVRKGRMHRTEAAHRVAVAEAIRQDLRDCFAPIDGGEPALPPIDGAVPWSTKVKWITDELARRRHHYPDRVAKGRLTKADAARQIDAIARLHVLYWQRGFCWSPPEGPARDYLRELRTIDAADRDRREWLRSSPLAAAYHQAARDHFNAVEAELEGEQQGRLLA
jgi:hypothetical protein